MTPGLLGVEVLRLVRVAVGPVAELNSSPDHARKWVSRKVAVSRFPNTAKTGLSLNR
jgi:hypothetical protein